MKPVIVLLCLLFFCSATFAAEGAKSGRLSRMTEKRMFRVDMTIAGKELKTGVNTIDILISDKAGKRVNGADITVKPWFTQLNQGVWEKPTVTELQNGLYRVQNIMLIKGGNWELKVSVKKGQAGDHVAFPFTVADQKPVLQKEAVTGRLTYERSIQRYRIPNVTLLNQDGKRVNLRAVVEEGKPVIIDFIYTTCTTICPVLSAGFVNLRKALGPDAEKVRFISLSIDPDHDRPENMKEYLAKFNAGKEWDFLSGSRKDVNAVLKSLDAYIVDKMDHEPIYLLHGPNSEEWVRIRGLIKKADLLKEMRRMESK